MKYFIFDSSNDGIVWTGPSIVVANKLKEGLIDCDMGSLGPYHPSYAELTVDTIATNNQFWDGKGGRVKLMKPEDANQVYNEKKRLAKLRSVSMYTLNGYAQWAYRKTQSFPHAAMDAELAAVLEQCDPEAGIFSFGIVEYALTCKMSNLEAYKQLRLRVDNYCSQRMRVYSYFDYYSGIINRATTDADIQAVNTDMHKKFIKDSFI
jgi:hypothetical protein